MSKIECNCKLSILTERGSSIIGHEDSCNLVLKTVPPKKYRLKIIYPVNEEDFDTAASYKSKGLDNCIFVYTGPDVFTLLGSKRSFSSKKIPKSWLTEIKEPLSFEEWFKKWFKKWFSHYSPDENIHDDFCLKMSLHNAWDSAIENYKLSLEQGNDNN